MTCNLPSLGVTSKEPLIYKIKFKMILEQMQLVGDSSKSMLKNSVTETHCNRIVSHWTPKIYQI